MTRWRRPERAVGLASLFGGWTLFVWVGRLRNLLAEPGSILDASRWSLVGALAFTALGLVVVLAALLRWSGRPAGIRSLGPAVAALGALTIGVWVVRAIDIAGGDHSTGFIAVHLVLAVVSIGLAVAAGLSLRRDGIEPGEGPGRDAETTGRRLPSKRWVSL